MTKPILFFDSGIGGLTVLRQTRFLLPARQFVYVADDAGFPYGNWDEDKLRTHLLESFTGLLTRFSPELAVIACNTASTIALTELRAAFPDTKFVGTVPAIKPAAERSASGLVSVLATPGTVRRAYTRDLIQSFASHCHVRLVGSESLAAWAEAHVRQAPVDQAAIKTEITPCFVSQDGRQTDIVVLACTHYPFLTDVFRKLAPWPVDWLDPAGAIAARVVSLVAGGKPGRSAPVDRFLFTSAQPSFAARQIMRGFGLNPAASA